MILVSACLAGLDVRYDGGNCLNHKIQKMVEHGEAVTICPEVIGGLTTPREPAEIINGNGFNVLNGSAKVVNKVGEDVTEFFLKGAYETLKKAQEVKATMVVLKENSPSCGSKMIYNGKFVGQKIDGIGVTAALLKENGFSIISEEELANYLSEMEKKLPSNN